MARAKRLSEIRRQLLRRLDAEPDLKLEELRDRLWDDLIVRRFKRGHSVVTVASEQPRRDDTLAIECAIRRYMRRG
jgi:hypothetical protein